MIFGKHGYLQADEHVLHRPRRWQVPSVESDRILCTGAEDNQPNQESPSSEAPETEGWELPQSILALDTTSARLHRNA